MPRAEHQPTDTRNLRNEYSCSSSQIGLVQKSITFHILKMRKPPHISRMLCKTRMIQDSLSRQLDLVDITFHVKHKWRFMQFQIIPDVKSYHSSDSTDSMNPNLLVVYGGYVSLLMQLVRIDAMDSSLGRNLLMFVFIRGIYFQRNVKEVSKFTYTYNVCAILFHRQDQLLSSHRKKTKCYTSV